MVDVTSDYLDDFATPIEGEPNEILTNGMERLGGAGISPDDTEGTFLNVIYEDEYEKTWQAKKGTDKRRTLVRPLRDGKTHGLVVYAFPGLKSLNDIRNWYRAKFDIVDLDPGQSAVALLPKPE